MALQRHPGEEAPGARHRALSACENTSRGCARKAPERLTSDERLPLERLFLVWVPTLGRRKKPAAHNGS